MDTLLELVKDGGSPGEDVSVYVTVSVLVTGSPSPKVVVKIVFAELGRLPPIMLSHMLKKKLPSSVVGTAGANEGAGAEDVDESTKTALEDVELVSAGVDVLVKGTSRLTCFG